ncbi:MAG: type III-B CRISPR module RAMP protein Cmr6 [Saprospiraceae bacterium]|nr:type III-B CRISPR module RAMP protein Cmr6 [Saprospiraceae bacterium]
MKNAGWHFYRAYYDVLTMDSKLLENFVKDGKFFNSQSNKNEEEEKFFYDSNRPLLEFKFSNSASAYFMAKGGFSLKTTYPGLLIGSGYGHQTGTQGEFKLGFFFDHTTGLPCIPGSSVKGLLRSAFPGDKEAKEKKAMKIRFVQALLKQINSKLILSAEEIGELERNIFEGEKTERMHGQDVFLDAFPEKGARSDLLFADDYITPHPDALKNPKPVRFMKIRPGVQFRFNFILHPVTIGKHNITAAEKEALFKRILEQFGIGAKTNTGYGQLID